MLNAMVIIKYIRRNNITKDFFCKLCKIDDITLDDIVYLGKYDNATLEKIANIIGIGYYDFFRC